MSENIERLEDLAPELQAKMLTLRDTDKSGIIAPELSHDISERDYIQMAIDGKMHLTWRGAELVADYQRRQMAQRETNMIAREIERIAREDALEQSDWQSSPEHTNQGAASLKNFEPEKPPLFTRIQAILDLAEYYMPGELAENSGKVSADIQEFRDYRALMDKQLAELQAENVTLTARNQELIDALKPFALDWIQYQKYLKKYPEASYERFALNTLNFDLIANSTETSCNLLNRLSK